MNWIKRIRKDFKREWKETTLGVKTLNIFAILITLIIGGIGIYFTCVHRDVDVSEITVGLNAFYSSSVDDLEDRYVVYFKPSNKYLKKTNSRFRFIPDVCEVGNYAYLIKNLNNNKIDMAFVSLCTYTYLREKMGEFANFTRQDVNNIILLGYLKKDKTSIYYAGILYNKKNEFFRDSIENIKKQFFNLCTEDTLHKRFTDSLTFCFNIEDLSTSSHVIPEIFLYEHGINVKQMQKIEYKDRKEMISGVKDNKNYIAFISNEDYDNGKFKHIDTTKLGFIPINIPIPQDAVLANKKWWNKLSTKDQNIIVEALHTNRIELIYHKKDNQCCSITNILKDTIYQYAREYLTSGIVYKKSGDTAMIVFPFEENKKIINQDTIWQLVKFDIENKTTKTNFTMYKLIVEDSIKLLNSKNPNNYYVISDKAKQGMHIIPIKSKSKKLKY